MKIKYNLDDELPLNKTIEIPTMTIVVRAIFFMKIANITHKFFLEECLYKLQVKFRFTFQPNVCNRCHDLLMMSVNLINTAILNIKGSDYRSIINLIMDKSGTKNLMQNADFTKKSRTL